MGQIGNVWVDIGGDASDLKRAAQEGKAALEDLKRTAQQQLGLSGVSDEFARLNQGLLTGLSQTQNSVGSTQKSISGLAFSFTELNQAIAIGKRALSALEDVWDFAEEGSRLASLEQASYRLADSYGANMADIVTSVQAASFNTITEYDAMKAANLAMTMGVSTNATEIANLMEIATERGRAFGITTEEAFDRITRGIGRRSTRILDDLGFSANATYANKVYAESLGIETSALTDQMRVRALFNLILEQGNAELEKSGGLAEDISTPFQRLSASWKQLFSEAKIGAAYNFAPLISSAEETIQHEAQLSSQLQKKDAGYTAYFLSQWRSAIASGKQMITGITYMSKSQYEMTQRWNKEAEIAARVTTPEGYATPGWDWSTITTKTDSVINFGYAISDLVDKESLAIGLSGEIAKAQETYTEAMKEAKKDTDKQSAALDDLNESYQSFILDTMQSLEFDPMATFRVGAEFENVDNLSMALYAAIGEVKDLGLGSTETAGKILDIYDNFNVINELKLQDKSFNILVNFLINGIPSYDFTPFTERMIGGFAGVNINKPLDISKKHGGSFVGLAHGGIVPPGFSNDRMPIWVSSGERVDVTPAGNKNIENEQLAGMINELLFAIRGLPRDIRDAVQMVS